MISQLNNWGYRKMRLKIKTNNPVKSRFACLKTGLLVFKWKKF